jgi:hypothetical protein
VYCHGTVVFSYGTGMNCRMCTGVHCHGTGCILIWDWGVLPYVDWGIFNVGLGCIVTGQFAFSYGTGVYCRMWTGVYWICCILIWDWGVLPYVELGCIVIGKVVF